MHAYNPMPIIIDKIAISMPCVGKVEYFSTHHTKTMVTNITTPVKKYLKNLSISFSFQIWFEYDELRFTRKR